MIDPNTMSNELHASNMAYTAWIEIDGVRSRLYNVHTEGSLTSAFVESWVGARVALCFKGGMTSLQHDLKHEGVVDGSLFDSQLWRSNDRILRGPLDHPRRTQRFTGTRVNGVEEQRLVLGPMLFTENASLACQNEQILRGIGTISLKLWWGTAAQEPVLNPRYPDGPLNQDPLLRALQVTIDVTERAALGPIAPRAHQDYYHFDSGNAAPFAEFRFHYRSKETLQRRGYMPRSPASDDSWTLVGSDEGESGSDEELDEQIRDQRQRARAERERLRNLQRDRQARRLARGSAGSLA